MSICFLSKTFFEREKLSDIIVPMPSFYVDSKKPWLDINVKDNKKIQELLEKHKIELDIILKHSPYKTNEELFAEFDKITTSSGTLVTIYNLKLNIEGDSELDFTTDKYDIQMSDLDVDFDRKRQYEHKSFRHYVSILYLDPKMKIYIQNKKVRTKMLDRCLYRQFVYSYTSTTFKKNAEKEATKCEDELRRLNAEFVEANSKLKDYNNKNSSKPFGYHTELTVLRRKKEELEQSLEKKKLEVSIKKKSAKEQKKLEFIFGINLHNRNADGLFLYNCNRLIMMFEHTKLQKDNEYRGIVGIVNIPYLVSEPTHNKQGFKGIYFYLSIK
jgi:MORC family CW-type zinc finger protein